MNHNQTIGSRGEHIALRYLQSLGYGIYGRNVRISHDEVDILAYDHQDECVVFAEVKTRSTKSADYHPFLNVTTKKKYAFRRLARRWVAEHDYDGGYRMDVICVAAGKVIDHVKEVEW